MKLGRFLTFEKWKLKVTTPIWCRIIIRSLCFFQTFEFRVKMCPQTLADPKSESDPYPFYGCRGGSRYFEGYHKVSRSPRFKKMIARKYQDATPIQNYSNIFNLFSTTCLIWYGLLRFLMISGIQRFIETSPSHFLCSPKQSRLNIVWGPPTF